eukprot:9428864-Pyramimonas_sp.AAC.1
MRPEGQRGDMATTSTMCNHVLLMSIPAQVASVVGQLGPISGLPMVLSTRDECGSPRDRHWRQCER